MATLAQLVDDDSLIGLDPGLAPGVQPERLVYLAPRMVEWLAEKLPELASDRFLEITPEEQVSDLFERFCSGEELMVGTAFKILHPKNDAVWELKTGDVRVFGWFAQIDVFVAVSADSKNRIEEYGLYRGYIDTVVRFREELALDLPKFVPGENPHAVVSNYCFP